MLEMLTELNALFSATCICCTDTLSEDAFSRSISTLTCGREICKSLDKLNSEGTAFSLCSILGTHSVNSDRLGPCMV